MNASIGSCSSPCYVEVLKFMKYLKLRFQALLLSTSSISHIFVALVVLGKNW